jgi:hypothetical protein
MAGEVLSKVRFKLSDTTISKYSDTELLYALNEGVHILWQQLNLNYSSLTRRVQGYDLNARNVMSALLPEDFDSLVSLEHIGDTTAKELTVDDILRRNHYAGSAYHANPRIEGEHIVGFGNIRLVYNYIPREVTMLNDVIDVPDQLIPDIVAVTANIASQQMDAARQRADEAARRTSQNREYTNPPQRRCFP